MIMTNQYDIIIIGTGCGGSTMAYKLAPTGKRILILERGGFIPKEKQNWDAHEVVTLGRYRPDDIWVDQDNKPFKPFIHYNVGGNSKMYGAALFRFRESDFEKVSHYGGTSPAWPFGYDELESYYERQKNCIVYMAKEESIPQNRQLTPGTHFHKFRTSH